MRGQEKIFEESQGKRAGMRFIRNERIGGEMVGDECLDFASSVGCNALLSN